MMLTKSYTYVLPMLSEYILLRKDFLMNSFIGDVEYAEYDNHIFLLHKFRGSKSFLLYEHELSNSNLFVDSYDPDKHSTMHVFKVPKKYQKQYDLFKEGKYSKLDYEYKVLIFKFHGITDPEHRVAKVLFKHEDLKEEIEDRIGAEIPKGNELSSVPDLSVEIFSEKFKTKKPLKPEEKPFE